jgi:hypothetical protein
VDECEFGVWESMGALVVATTAIANIIM